MNWLKTFLAALDDVLWQLIHGDLPAPKPQNRDIVVETPKPMPPIQTNAEKLYEAAKASLGKDIARTQSELGCAEAVSYLLHQIDIPDFPRNGFLSTTDLHNYLA